MFLGLIRWIKTIFEKNLITVISILLIIIFADILFIPNQSDGIYFVTICISIISIMLYNLKSSVVFELCLALLCTMGISYMLNGASVMTEKAAVWLILYWLVGIGIQSRELYAKK